MGLSFQCIIWIQRGINCRTFMLDMHAEDEGVYQIPDGILIEGSIPSNKEKLLMAWIEIHKEELMADWQLASSGNKVFVIDPLK